ncbi:phage baseplate assembly protein V (plasmid) [Embleya sp. NBC_00888]|uniref:phage baseplate assembly protein V n=1 Tax=Embleya sp. NBC_00888 TaxID=2975960 RepID=UPI002F907D3D|nr:phage baseplate assembly protein V [Embleya sp. NBC_00888]
MFEPLFDALDDIHASDSPRVTGVAPATVVDNLDLTGAGRVLVRYAWLPGVEPWARVCAPVAGDGSGVWFMPQPGDEVLVAFRNGDVREPYVLGGLWTMTSRPPVDLPTDSVTKRVIRTPVGHEVAIDDLVQTVTLTHALGHSIEMSVDGITLAVAGGAAKISLTTSGAVTVTGTRSVEVSGLDVSVEAGNGLAAKATRADIRAAATCSIQGALVKIN